MKSCAHLRHPVFLPILHAAPTERLRGLREAERDIRLEFQAQSMSPLRAESANAGRDEEMSRTRGIRQVEDHHQIRKWGKSGVNRRNARLDVRASRQGFPWLLFWHRTITRLLCAYARRLSLQAVINTAIAAEPAGLLVKRPVIDRSDFQSLRCCSASRQITGSAKSFLSLPHKSWNRLLGWYKTLESVGIGAA